MNVKSIGILSVLLASFLWALEPVLAKLSYQSSDFQHTLAVRAILVTLTAFVYGGITNKANFKIDRRQLSALVYVAVVANILGDIAYFFALTQVPVTNAVVIGYMQPILVWTPLLCKSLHVCDSACLLLLASQPGCVMMLFEPF